MALTQNKHSSHFLYIMCFLDKGFCQRLHFYLTSVKGFILSLSTKRQPSAWRSAITKLVIWIWIMWSLQCLLFMNELPGMSSLLSGRDRGSMMIGDCRRKQNLDLICPISTDVRWNDSAGRGTCQQAWWPELGPRNQCEGHRRESTPGRWPLNSPHALCHKHLPPPSDIILKLNTYLWILICGLKGSIEGKREREQS